MKRVILFLVTVSVVVILPSGVQAQEPQKPNSATSNAAADPLKAASEKLRSVLGGSINIEDLACTFRPAIWVGLPVTIRISGTETSDGQPYIFVMKKGGLLSKDKDPNPLSMGISVDRQYGITFKNAEDAFAKGAPFYISDLVFDSPTVFHYTVTSNPKVSIEYAQLAIQETGEGYNIGSVSDSLKSDAKPQRLTKTLPTAPDPKKKTYFSIVDHDRHWCISSNDVLLDSSAAPKQ